MANTSTAEESSRRTFYARTIMHENRGGHSDANGFATDALQLVENASELDSFLLVTGHLSYENLVLLHTNFKILIDILNICNGISEMQQFLGNSVKQAKKTRNFLCMRTAAAK